MDTYQRVLTAHLDAIQARPIGSSPHANHAALAGGTATVFRALFQAPHNTISFEELSELSWPAHRPGHWRALLSFYGRRLQDQLPTGWQVIDNADQLRLSVKDGSLDQWALYDDVAAQLPENSPQHPGRTDSEGSSETPRPPARRLSLRRIHQDVATPATSRTTESLCGMHHQNDGVDLPALCRAEQFAVVTHGPDHPALTPRAWRDMSADTDLAPDCIFVAGLASDLPFGDAAAAFAPARWQLLGLDPAKMQASVTKAWRILGDCLRRANDTVPSIRHAVIIDAHRLDDHSLALAEMCVKFPLSPNVNITFVGDSTDPRPAWQQLLQTLKTANRPRFELCPTCGPELPAGHINDHRPAQAS